MGQVLKLANNFVILMPGEVDLARAKEGGDETVRTSEPGTSAIVPRDTWHTARVHRHSVMMFIIAGEGAINSEEPVRG